MSLEITTEKRRTTSQNVIAGTQAQGRVLLVGAHLDSVLAGPGINDNGTGVAALLEIARVTRGRAPEARSAVRVLERRGVRPDRVARLRERHRGRAAHGLPQLRHARDRGGSVGVYKGPFAQRLLGYFKQRGLHAEIVDLTGRSDHFPFEQIGVPTGGLFAGVDNCYHTRCDRLAGSTSPCSTTRLCGRLRRGVDRADPAGVSDRGEQRLRVELGGLEPPTSWVRSRRSPS